MSDYNSGGGSRWAPAQRRQVTYNAHNEDDEDGNQQHQQHYSNGHHQQQYSSPTSASPHITHTVPTHAPIHTGYAYNQPGSTSQAQHIIGYTWDSHAAQQLPRPQQQQQQGVKSPQDTGMSPISPLFPQPINLSMGSAAVQLPQQHASATATSSSALSSSSSSATQDTLLHRRVQASSSHPTSVSQTISGQIASSTVRPLHGDRPITVQYFLNHLLTTRFLLTLAAICTALTIITVPFVFFHVESSEQLFRPTSDPSGDVFCPSPQYAESMERISKKLPAWQHGRCVPCPAYGICNEGYMECLSGYFRQMKDCVRDEEQTREALKMKEEVIQKLEEHAGRRLCGDTTSAGAPSADLTELELSAYIRGFHPTPDEERIFLHHWSLAINWLNWESPPPRSKNNPYLRVNSINVDPMQPKRYRAVYPALSLSCRIKNVCSSHWWLMIFWGLLLTLVLIFIRAVRFIFLVAYRSNILVRDILAKVREDYFYDYDRRIIIHQAQSLEALKNEFLPLISPSSISTADTDGDNESYLLSLLVWQRVQSLMRANSSVEKGEYMFQYGLAPSWRWIGPRPDSAEQYYSGSAGGGVEDESPRNMQRNNHKRGNHVSFGNAAHDL